MLANFNGGRDGNPSNPKEACRKLRKAKQDEILREKWNVYRRFMKKLIRKEKKEMRKRTLRKI